MAQLLQQLTSFMGSKLPVSPEVAAALPSLIGSKLPISPQMARDMTPGMLTVLAAVPFAFYLLKRVIFPSVSPREPPVLRPTIPFFGHVVSMIREKTGIFDRL